MKSTASLLGPVLTAVLLLASCNGTDAGTGSTDNGSGGVVQPVAGAIVATAYRAVTVGSGFSSDAEIRITGTASRTATVTVRSAPASLTVTPEQVTVLDTGELSVPLTVTGTAQSGESVRLDIAAGGKSTTLEVPVMSFQSLPIAAAGISVPYAAAALRFGTDGTAYLSAGVGGNAVERRNLLRFDAATQSFSLVPFRISLSSEAITSQTVAPDGTQWVAVRGMTSRGSYLVSRDSAGTLKTYYPDAVGDNLANLTTTTDGRIWMTQYTHPAVKSLTPGSGAVDTYAVPEQADSLIRGQDGKLYYASIYARPAIVQLDPATGQTRSFDVGAAGQSLPTALAAAPDGTIWFVEARGGAVWRLNPATGQQTQFVLPTGAHPLEIAVTSGGKVWISDNASAGLYTTFTGSSGQATLVAYRPPTGGKISALSIGPDDKLWYVAGGNLVRQQ